MKFCIINKTQAVSKSTDENGTLYITGIANSGIKDLVGDVVMQSALQQIAEAATTHNLHLDHDSSIEGVLGPIVQADVTENGVEIKARIIDERRELIEPLLLQGVHLGLSISGIAGSTDDNINMIDKWDLTEISITPVPCDQATMGSVQIAKSIKEVLKEAENNRKTEEETDDDTTTDEGVEESKPQPEDNEEGETMAEEPIYLTEEEVTELINTAFTEKQEEFLEILRGEIKTEYEAVIAAQEERINSIEAQLEALKQPAEGDEGGEEGAGEEGGDKGTTEEEEEDEEKRFEEIFAKCMSKMFNIHEGPSEPSFKYEGKHTETETKGLTPREIAEMLAK